MKIVKKLFFIWGEQKEKLFLEKMAKDGYKLVKVRFGKYYFEEDTSKDVVYQFDYKGLSKITEDEYLGFYNDTGWTLACQYGGWYYFYQEINEGEEIPTIYSDNHSMKARYRRLMFFLLLAGFPLYYQALIFFPNMLITELSYPKFYFFFRIIVYIFMVLHMFALYRIFRLQRNLEKKINE